ncbi:Mitogen-activated protein kinase SLT2/MPK1 [Termitomyces sp. J132]|nr:Mitogen-activated protein kinase SLT2/MPK1 [Termitomyces sp. J132]
MPSRSPRNRSPRGHRRLRSKGKDDKVSPVASPGPWNVDRGRSRQRRSSNPLSEENLRRRGYHSLLSSFGKVFHVEKRWKLIREMGSGAYGVVISAEDEISKETVAIKLVTRIFDKVQLAKRALREITLLRHFASHENITGLIDVDAISPDFNEIYIFMEPMEGMKFVHSASVVHRDLKPGNLLVNADCELKICDFGLSRGFDSRPDEYASHLTEYVATRWYRAPEIMLAFRRYDTAIDVWSIGCILAELLLGKPLFKGKDYVDQLNKVLDVLGTPDEGVIRKIDSNTDVSQAQAYVRSLPFKRKVPFRKILPAADPQALDLLGKMLAFDPSDRITVPQALEHPWLASYHDESDEPECARTFEKWRQIEELETLEDFRTALWNEIEEYRREVRGLPIDDSADLSGASVDFQSFPHTEEPQNLAKTCFVAQNITDDKSATMEAEKQEFKPLEGILRVGFSSSPEHCRRRGSIPTDPVVTYARRSSIHQPLSRQGSTYPSPAPPTQHLPTTTEGQIQADSRSLQTGSVVFPTQQGYVVPARSRAGSMAGGEVTRKLLRTLSTVSIHESVEGLEGGLAGIAPIGKYIMEGRTEADAPPSEMPREFGPEGNEGPVEMKRGKEGKFRI